MKKDECKKGYIRIIPIIIIIVIISFSIVLTNLSPSLLKGTASILRDDFVLSFLGIFAGFALAIITFIYPTIRKINECLKNLKAENKISKYNIKITNILSELKQDTIIIIISLVLAFILILVSEINFGNLYFLIPKSQLVSIFKISFILITFVALLDIVFSLFKLIEITISLDEVNRN